MKILHTADLHLGRLFHEYSLIEDQKYMLDQLIETADSGLYDALIIAGDVYDRSIPSPEAVNLLSGFLEQLRRRCPSLHIFLIPGNHDSADRLGFGSALFTSLGIHIVSDPEESEKPIIIEDTFGKKAAVFLLPFLTPGSLSSRENIHHQNNQNQIDAEDLPLRSQQKLSEEASARLQNSLKKITSSQNIDYTILAAHLFTLGGKESESERIFLGTAEQIDAKLFSSFDYIALGHLHKCQKVLPNMFYAGSPLTYSFDEAESKGSAFYEKVFLSVEFLKPIDQKIQASEELFSQMQEKITVTKIPVKPLRKVSRLKGTFNDFFSSRIPISEEIKNGYIEISLEDMKLVENPLALLRSRFPHLLSIRQDDAFTEISKGFDDASFSINQEKNRRSLNEDFESFLTEIYGQNDPEKTKLFTDLLKESEHEAD
jgi:exonuclease SbcD